MEPDCTEWSLHAQLIVRHNNTPVTKSNNDNMKTEYSWEPGSVWETHGTGPKPLYGFQKGNLLFTTSPPQSGMPQAPHRNTLPRRVDKSAYSYEPRLTRSPTILSSTSPRGNLFEKFSTLPSRRPIQQYERRCRSTCSITLQCDTDKPVVSRTQSLKNPNIPCYMCNGIGNVCSECCRKKTQRAHTFATHFASQVLSEEEDKKDAASQTVSDEISTDDQSKQTKQCQTMSEDSLLNVPQRSKVRKKLSRSPARVTGKSTLKTDKDTQTTDNKKQPKTVHIDVYCTDSEGSESSSSSPSSSSTVYESEDCRVTHRRAGQTELPQRRKKKSLRIATESDVSSMYRSTPASSRSTLLDSTSNFTTTDSTTTFSHLCTDDSCDSLESSVQSSCASLTQNDSFDYADSCDRVRIKQMEHKWSNKEPIAENKHLIQQEKFDEYVKSRDSFPSWRSSETETDSSNESEMGWTFQKIENDQNTSDDSSLKREDTVRRATKPPTDSAPHRFTRRDVLGPFGTKPPSPPPLKVQNLRTLPFTEPIGRTQCFQKAEKFGTIINAFKKPGHHVGPAKNPDCTCGNCLRYFSELRGRTKSAGDITVPSQQYDPNDLV